VSEFAPAITYVFQSEGGYVNDPDDPGGETKYGICKRDHPNIDIKNLTDAQAEDIYRDQYWCYAGIVQQRVATKLLDMAVHMEGNGHQGRAVRITQAAANCQLSQEGMLRVDSEYGLMTEAGINLCHPEVLLRDMCRLSAEHYARLIAANSRLLKFQRNWLARAARLPQ
jgi:lysozyme family protein